MVFMVNQEIFRMSDLVQAVLEAQEKGNSERVDMLVTNAIKQLKISRFKPDHATCISLTYLARINPKIFAQSSGIKEMLKLSLRRDNGPANIKGKNDILLPVLSANILLACCDTTEIRSIILNKIEQWLTSNQKVAEIVQHLLATICMKCQGDQQTIAMLIGMRQHWLQYLEDNSKIYGSTPSDLCSNIRILFRTETSCASLIVYLKILIKHDPDIEGLGRELAKFITERPMYLISMLNEEESAVHLICLILKVFIKLFTMSKELNHDIIVEPMLYVKLASSQVVVLSRPTIEAVLSLMAALSLMNEVNDAFRDEFNQLLDFWKSSDIYEDQSLTRPHNLSDGLRQRLTLSSSGCLIELGLQNANVSQLVDLIQQFGLPLTTINIILKRLNTIDNVEIIKPQVKDQSLFSTLLEFYHEMGALGAKELNDQLQCESKLFTIRVQKIDSSICAPDIKHQDLRLAAQGAAQGDDQTKQTRPTIVKQEAIMIKQEK